MHNELLQLYEEVKDKDYSIGNALFTQSKFFVDSNQLINAECQKDIKVYNYSKLSNTPPYPSVKETPYTAINNFLIIEEEIGHIKDGDK